MKLFISGNQSVTFLSQEAYQLIREAAAMLGADEPDEVLVGDASGVDSLIQLSGAPCTVYYSGLGPRNYSVHLKKKKVEALGMGRAWHTYKDKAMSDDCDLHVGVVDATTKRYLQSGTKANHDRVIAQGKPSALVCAVSLRVIDLNKRNRPTASGTNPDKLVCPCGGGYASKGDEHYGVCSKCYRQGLSRRELNQKGLKRP